MTWRQGRSWLHAVCVLAAIECLLLALFPARASRAEDPFTVSITGIEHVWYVRYPGPDGVLGSEDDRMGSNDLHLPASRPIRILVHSEDYIYRVYSPGIDLNKMAIPRKEVVAELATLKAGIHDFEGEPMCGLKLGDMVGQVVVQTPEDFARWSNAARPFETSFGLGGEGSR